MADQRLADLPLVTAVTGVGVVYLLDDVSGTPVDSGISVDNLLGGVVAQAQEFNIQSGTTYTIQESDSRKVVRCTNSGDVVLTLPALSTGFRCEVAYDGTGTLTVSRSGSVLVNGQTSVVLAGQYSKCELMFVESNTARAYGNIVGAPGGGDLSLADDFMTMGA
jgi:hypothetical protein